MYAAVPCFTAHGVFRYGVREKANGLTVITLVLL
jgi:hypothetical protein